MKYLVILGDGMSDCKIPALGNKTCLEAAKTPTFDRIAPLSEIGLCKNVPNGLKPGSDVANMSVMGFDPKLYYTGRSPLEAVAMGIPLKDTDVTLRCNLVTLSDDEPYENKTMLDYSAGEITTEESEELIMLIESELGDGRFTFYPGISYRHCLVVENGSTGHTLTPPHDITDRPIKDFLPKGEYGEKYLSLMKDSYKLLSRSPINLERIAKGKNPANSIWLWGEGTKPAIADFYRLHGKKGGVISAVDLLKGIALLAGMQYIPVDGATGNYDTNFKGKADAAVDALLSGLDFVYVHMEAPDECGHHGDYRHKVYSIEQVDGVVDRVIKRLDAAGEKYAMLILPDHPTPCATKTHSSEPVPYLLYSNVHSVKGIAARYTEDEAEKGEFTENGYKLIDKLFAITEE